nr:protein [Spodoptera litura nucleopolyhedrovirus]WML75133.1 hypothetical protein KBIHDJOI_00090 [Spodoptera littoralis nucleopolyhedrovirus]
MSMTYYEKSARFDLNVADFLQTCLKSARLDINVVI